MKRTKVVANIAKAAKAKGVEFREVELTKHTGIVVGGLRRTIGRHTEIDEITVKKFYKQFEDILGKGLVAVSNYTVEAERGKLRWSLQCVEAPGAISEVDRLGQAEVYMKEAISFVTGESENDITISVVPILSESTREHLERARVLAARAEEANAAAARERRAAARELREKGLTVREVGTVLGVSHQRAQQLMQA